MHSKSLTVGRNGALNFRADLKEQDQSVRGYVKFPAILMIKHTGERKYSLEKEFGTRVLSFELHLFLKKFSSSVLVRFHL